MWCAHTEGIKPNEIKFLWIMRFEPTLLIEWHSFLQVCSLISLQDQIRDSYGEESQIMLESHSLVHWACVSSMAGQIPATKFQRVSFSNRSISAPMKVPLFHVFLPYNYVEQLGWSSFPGILSMVSINPTGLTWTSLRDSGISDDEPLYV